MGLLLLVFCSLLPAIAICFYLAAARTRFVTNTSVILLRTLLKLQGLIGSNDTDCVVEPCPGGIVLKGVALPDKLLELATGSVIVQSVSINRLHLLWATSSLPLTLCVTGVAIGVLQRRTAPKVQPTARPVQRHAGKLRALEALLWDGRRHGGLSGWRGRQLRLLRFFIALALRNISVVVADVEFQYRQTGDPAPVLKLPETPGAVDAISLTIRTIEVSPASVDSNGQAQVTAAGRRDAGPSTGPEPSMADSAVGRNDQASTGPPPAVHRWRNVSSLFPRVQAIYNWLDALIATYQPVGDCNASQVTVAGVNLALMSKSPLGLKRAASSVQQHAGRQQAGLTRPSGLQRLRGRSSPAGRASAMPARAPAPTRTGKSAPAAPAAHDWDSVLVVLRQWSIQVDVFVGPRPARSSHPRRPTARTGQPLAVHIQGYFGIRGQQRSVEDSVFGAPDAQQNAPTGASGSLPRRMGGHAGAQASRGASVCGQSQPPSNLSRSSSVFRTQQLPAGTSSCQGATPTAAAGREPHASDARLVIHVDVTLKALVPELTPDAAVQLLRMVDRLLTYEKYSVYWSQRPSVSVTQSPAAWWQHVGRAVINDCREHFPLRNLRVLMARRAEYIRVYKELHSMQHGFVPVTYQPQYQYPLPEDQKQRGTAGRLPVRREMSSSRTADVNPPGVATARQPQLGTPKRQKFVFPRAKPQPPRLAWLSDQLVWLESQLPLGQIMCNRTFVALWHSSKLRDARAQAQWTEAMGVITNFVDAIPTMDEEEEPDSNFGADFASATVDRHGDRSGGRTHRAPATPQISLGIHCPRVGLRLINKHTLAPSPAAMLGSVVESSEPTATSGPAKRPADVLGVILEGIGFFMPDVYRISVQATTIKASLLGGASSGPKHVLIVPASRECTDRHATKLDFSGASQSLGHASAMQGPLPGNSKSWAAEGAIYPDAPLSLYLSRYKVRLAAVEVALSNPPLVVAAARFLDSMVQLKAAASWQAGAGASASAHKWPSTKLHSLVMDSYMRNRVRLPSSMAVFMPKLQFFCPLVSARWMLSPAHTPSIGGISEQRSEALTVAVVSNVRVASRYVHTCYGSLVQATSAQAHVEVYFQLQPRSEGQPSATKPAADSPQLDHFAKMWLHPDDVELAFPAASTVLQALQPQDTAQEPSLSRRQLRSASRISQSSAAATGMGASLPTAPTLGSEVARAGAQHAPLSYPFLPLLKIRSFSALALNQVPYEPAVPGTMTAHQTVGVHSVMAWFSPWHAMVINGAVDSILTHPVLVYLRKLQQSGTATASEPVEPPSSTSRQGSSDDTPAAQHTRETSACATKGGGSSISLLLDLPLLTMNCYAEMPKAFGALEDLGSQLNAMKSGDKLQLASWITKRLALTGLSASVDPVVRWGLRLTPLLTVDITNVRSGLRLTRHNSVMARLQTTGLQISDQQARLKRSLYEKVWLANSGQGSSGPASESTEQLLGPLATRAAAMTTFARDRRRAALCLLPSVAPGSERLGQLRQQWRRLLEVQLVHRASDFAMFLLSPTHRSAARQHMYGLQAQPLENYRILFQQHMKDSSPRTPSPGASASPSELASTAANSPSRSGVLNSVTAGVSRSVPSAMRDIPGHFRSVSALDSVAALFSRSNRVSTTPHRKSTSLVQMLGAVTNQNLHRMVTLRHTAGLRIGQASAAEGGLAAPTRDVPALSRVSMGRIPEEVHLAPSDPFSFTSSEPGAVHLQPPAHSTAQAGPGSCPSLPRTAPSFAGGNDAGGRAGVRRLGRSGTLAAADAADSGMHSAFMEAKEQSRAAAQGHSSGSTSSLVGSSEADVKLSFVQAFRHLGIKTVRPQRRACVYNMPLSHPVVTVVMTQAADEIQSTALHASCDQLISCVGVHSVGSILLMAVQTQQALRSPVRAGKPRAEAPRTLASDSTSSSAPSRGVKATFDLGFMQMKVVMEEPPRRADASSPDGELGRQPGLTELTAIVLSGLSVKLLPGSSAEGSASQSVDLDIADISILDLQGCVEHRNVLIAKPFCRPLVDAASSARQRESLGSFGPDVVSVSGEGSNACRISVAYLVPLCPGEPALMRISVHDPCVTWLRRYNNNIMCAVGVISGAYRSAVRQSAATADQPAPVAASSTDPDNEPHAAAVSTGVAAAAPAAQSSTPGILVEAFNVKAVLPGGAAARHGPIRRAVHNEVLSVELQSLAVYVPGGASGSNLLQQGGLEKGAVWLTSADEVERLISSSLRLGKTHFPQVDQHPSADERPHVGPIGNEGGGVTGRQRQAPVQASPAGVSSPSKGLQKHLQAAKANFIDPLKEILQEAGHKRNKQRGEMGFLLIDEGPGRGPSSAVNPGYLDIEDVEARRPPAAAQHTTTTVHATVVHGTAGVHGSASTEAASGSQRQHAQQQQFHDDNSVSSSRTAGQGPNSPSARAVNGVHVSSAPGLSDAHHSPMVLISVSGLAAATGKLVPYDDIDYRRRKPAPQGSSPQLSRCGAGLQRQQSAFAPQPAAVRVSRDWMLPPDLCNAVLYDVGRVQGKERARKVDKKDPQVASALDLLADTELQSVRPLIDPVQLKGAVFKHAQHGAVQVHLSAPSTMVATLGPERYERMIKVLTDNVSEAYSCFNVGAARAASTTQRRTTFCSSTAFAPRPGQLPYFHLTVEWLDQLRVVLEGDPAWWRPSKAPGQGAEACLQSCFTQCSLGLMMTRKTNDMFLAFFSQQLHIADVRISTRDGVLDTPFVSAAYPLDANGLAPSTDTTAELMQTDTSRRPSTEGCYRRESGAAETLCDEDEDEGAWTAENADDASTESPDGHNIQPVVDDQLGDTFPGTAAVVTLLRSNIDLPANESAHLAGGPMAGGDPLGSGECPRDSNHNCVRVSFSMLQDGTMGNEIELCHTLVQWPYLTEMSLVSAIIAIFMPGWGCPASGPEALLRLAAAPWFYFNLLLRNSQIYVPVLAPHLRHLTYGWRAAAAQAAGEDIQLTPEKLQQLFASMVEDAVAVKPAASTAAGAGDRQQRASDRWASGGAAKPMDQVQNSVLFGGNRSTRTTVSPLGQPVLSGNWATLSMRHMAGVASSMENPGRLEQMGVVISMAALRIGYFAGGDGDSIIKVDLRNAAGFLRHGSAQVTNWLLPIRSMVMEYRCSTPMVEESRALEGYILTARVMVRRCLRVLRDKMRLRKRDDSSVQPQHPRVAEMAARPRQDKVFFTTGTITHDSDGLSLPGAGVNVDDAKSVRSRTAPGVGIMTAQDFLVEQATSRAAGLLELHKLPLPTSSASRVAVEKLVVRQPSVSKLTFELDTAVIRAAFSNIPLWHALMDDAGLATKLIQENNGIFSPAPAIARALQLEPPKKSSEATAEAKATWVFRPSSMLVHANMRSLGLVLCDDKPKSYGAPDVLTAAMEEVSVQYSMERRYWDHLPEQLGCISLCLAAQFLNNSTGRWEHLLEPWPAELHLSDPINPVFKSSRTKYVFVSSNELMKLTFHPSCLLTLGDTLSFVRRLAGRHEVTADTAEGRSHNAAPVAEDPPSVSEQMALLSGSILTRVPQRYLIQNYTGLMMSYWAPKADSDVQAASGKRVLPSGCSEELQVTPTAKQVKIVGPGGVVLTRLQAQVIVLSFEGTWMPISDVSVDVVGKYCYDLHSPTDDRHAPVVVDVALVGRTKILKVHSALYVQNGTSLRLSFRLHFPSVLLAGQVALGAGDQRLPGDQDIKLRVLKPGEGRYLPVVAALGGSLYLEARTPAGKGWCVYGTSKHDVIRLSPTVTDMLGQSGFIASGLPLDGQKGIYVNSPLHFAVKIRVKMRTEYSYTTFHSMEVPGPGLFAKASRPLEASIKICPTVVLTNSLPYHMEGYLISLNGAGKEPEAPTASAASPQATPKPPKAHASRPVTAAGGTVSTPGTLPASESRRLLKNVRRSETVLDEIPESDQDRIISVFERSLLPMLNLKAKSIWDSRTKHLGAAAPNDRKKCFLLALLRSELRWTAKRNAKEMELLVRTDTEPADKVTWQELEAFLEWAKHSIRLVHVQPGDTQRLYLDMHKQLVMCIKVPERRLVCTRPVEVNYGGGVSSNGEAELPDFMRLDYIDDTGKGFNDVWEKMRSTSHADTPMNFVKVVNQQFRDTAAAVGDRVVNTVRGVRDAALDVFSSGPHASKSAQPPILSEVAPLESDSVSYWRQHPDKLVRVQLLIRLGPGGNAASALCDPRPAEGAMSAVPLHQNEDSRHGHHAVAPSLAPAAKHLACNPIAREAGPSEAAAITVEQPCKPSSSGAVADGPSLQAAATAPLAAVSVGGAGPAVAAAADLGVVAAGPGAVHPATPFAAAVIKEAVGGTDRVSADGGILPAGVPPEQLEQPTATSPRDIARSDAPLPSVGALPPVRSILDRLRSSMVVGKLQDAKSSSPGRLAGKESSLHPGGAGAAAGPHMDGHVCLRLTYRPEAAPVPTPRISRITKRLQAAFNAIGSQDLGLASSRAKEGDAGFNSPSRPFRSFEAPLLCSGIAGASARCIVQVLLRVEPATSNAPERVRVQLVVTRALVSDSMAGASARTSIGAGMPGRRAPRLSLDDNALHRRGTSERASRPSMSGLDAHTAIAVEPAATPTPATRIPVTVGLTAGSPYTPRVRSGSCAVLPPSYPLTALTAASPSDASPGSVVVLHSGPISPISVPGGPGPSRHARSAQRPEAGADQQEAIGAGAARGTASRGAPAMEMRAGTAAVASVSAPGYDSSGDSSTHKAREAVDAVAPSSRGALEPVGATVHRPDTMWSENAAYKCGSSVSTISGSDLPTRVAPTDFHPAGDDALKAGTPGATRQGGMRLPFIEDAVRGSPGAITGVAAARESEAGSSSVPHPDSEALAAAPPSAVVGGLFGLTPPATLSEGYAQLELFQASIGSPISRGSRLGRRSGTLSGSLSLRRVPSRSPRSAGSAGVSGGVRDGIGRSTSNAGRSTPDRPHGATSPSQRPSPVVVGSPPSAVPAEDVLGSPFAASAAAAGAGGSPDASAVSEGDGDLPAIKETQTSSAADVNDSAGDPGAASARELSSPTAADVNFQRSQGRRLTADDVISTPRGLGGDSGSGDLVFDAVHTAAFLAEAAGRKVQSEKRIGERMYSSFRFRSRTTYRGIGKKGAGQPSKSFLARGGRAPPNPMELAKSAIQVVPRLPNIARNVGEKMVDGGHQVLQGVPQVASFVADTIMAGGQGVKEKVVESTGQAIKIAKPKIQKGLMAIAWKATEAMRRRKQGSDEVTMYDEASKPPRGGRRRAEVERAPKVLLLSVHNSLATKEEDHVCRLSLYAAYWVDNRTGFNLLFKDLDAPAGIDNLPFLLWHPVQVPGNRADAAGIDISGGEQPYSGAGAPHLDRSSVQRSTPGLVHSAGSAARRGSHGQPPVHRPALLNDQTRTRFRINHPHYSETDFCLAFTVATTNQKYSVDIKGEKSQAKVQRFEAIGSGRSSAHSGLGKLAQSPCLSVLGGDDSRQTTDALPKAQPSTAESSPQLVAEDRGSPSVLQLAAIGSIEQPAEQQQQQIPVDTSRSVAEPAGQPPNGASGTSTPIEAAAPSGTQDGVDGAVARAAPCAASTPAGLEAPSSAASTGTQQASREDAPRASVALSGVIPPRRPLETVCEITPAEDESEQGPSTPQPVFPAAFAPLPPIPEQARSVQALGVVGGSREAGFPDGSSVPHKPHLSMVAVSLSGEVPLSADDGRVSTPTAAGGRLPSSSAFTSFGGRRRSSRFPKARSGRGIEDGTLGQAGQQESSVFVPVRRLYQFAVEVWAAPSDTVFGRTKIITVKNKYLILNATGLTIEYKQKGTPDPDPQPVKAAGYGKGMRFSRRLQNNARAAWHWDNVYDEQELMIRPAGEEWDWSGSFKLPELEDYFGLRVRHRHRNDYVIIPVNISVGPAGSVLITLKSIGSVPPYMIINRCRDVVIHLKQADYNRRPFASYDNWDDWDEILPESNQIPFAWDEPRLRHVVKVATAQRGAAPDQASAMDVDLDAVDVNTVIYVQSRSTRTWSLAAQLDARERAKFLTDNAKKVYVTVYADGPTRVLCFSEDRSGVASLDDENSLVNLSYRLQRVSVRLKEVDQKLVQQLGGSLDPVLSVRQETDFPHSGSQQGAAPSDEARLPGPTRFGSLPGAARAVVAGSATGRHAALQAPMSSGTATPPTRVGPGSQVGQASFAFQRLPSIGQRMGSNYTVSIVPSSYRNPSVPSTTAFPFNPPVPRVQHSRSPSNQTYGGKLLGAPDGSPAALPDGERLGRPLESLPAFEGYVDLPIGGDLTVILRSVEGLTSSLNSNEKLVAVEAKMAVVSSTPELDGDDSKMRVTASWTQATDAVALQAAGNTGAGGEGDAAGAGSAGGAAGSSSGGGFRGGSGPSSGCAGRFTLQDHTEVFRDIAASSELQIDFFIAKGTEQSRFGNTHSHPARQAEQQAAAARGGRNSSAHAQAAGANRDIGGMAKTTRLAVSSGQFAGCVRIPLMSTIECDKGHVWRLPLERKTGSQLIRGFVTLSFQWSLTNEGMLVREVKTLERILDEKIELLAQLNPLPVSASNTFVRDPAAPAESARQDAPADAALMATAASPVAPDAISSDSRSLGLGAGGAAAAAAPASSLVPRSAPIRKTAKAIAESYYVNLELSVLEISGLLPREGLRASIAASMYGRQTANMMSIAMLPRALVSMSCGGETHMAAAGANSVNPRFPKNKTVFQNVPLGAKVSLKVLDEVSGSYHKVLAEAEIHLSHIPSTDPVYAWLALKRRKQGSRSQRVLALLMVMEEEGDADVQMLVRIKINKPQIHGVALAVTLDLAGVGLCAKTNLEELFNYTMQKIRTSLVQTRTEVQASLAVQTIQLDNQMLEAKNPVVLSAADVSGSSSLAQARRRHKARLAQRVGPTNPVLRMGSQDSAPQDPLLIFQVVYNQASSNHAMVNSKGQEDSVGILAFRKVILELGPLDFSADQEFIEGVVAYLNGIPLEDFYQDKAWQQKIDAMQSGNMTLLGGGEDLLVFTRRGKHADALAWLAAKEANELELLRGQSSMWFYLEEFYLSDVFINVTLALSSSFNAGASAFSSTNASGKEDDRQRSMVRGFLSRVSGSNGFQLINVTNVPIQLEYVELQNHLVNRVSLVNKLFRHYSWIAIAQARKVLGGAGPAIAAIPASLLWAGIALFDLGQDVAAKRVTPLVVPTRMGYVTFTLMGQVIGVMSRTMCAIMGLLPPRFSSDTVNLSDSETARRFGIKPQTLMDALYLSQRDVVLGLMSAAFGVVHDTAAGARWKGGLVALGVPMGLLKASVGLGVRPAAGAVEATSKLLQGFGLMCLGKRGIQGKLVRRVQAPGLAVTDVVQAARASAAQAAMQGALIAAWQAALPAISSSLADDEVVDVVAARSTRVVLLTNRHLAYLYARRHADGGPPSSSTASRSATHGAFSVTYRVKWIIPNGHIDNIRGLDRGYAVSVEYHKPVRLGRLSLKLPLHKGMRTATAEGHKDLIFRLNRHIGRAASQGEFGGGPAAGPVDAAMAHETSVQDLSIMGGAGLAC